MKHNGGKWTEARFNSFIKSALRSASRKWPPKWAVRKAAWVSRGVYTCAGYETKPHATTASISMGRGRKRVNNIFVDHIQPVGGPEEGGWDGVIKRLYCEVDGLQVLCRKCHDLKTKDERIKQKEERNARRS